MGILFPSADHAKLNRKWAQIPTRKLSIAPASIAISIHRVLASLELSVRGAGQPWVELDKRGSVLLWSTKVLLIGATVPFVNWKKITQTGHVGQQQTYGQNHASKWKIKTPYAMYRHRTL